MSDVLALRKEIHDRAVKAEREGDRALRDLLHRASSEIHRANDRLATIRKALD